MNVQLESPVVVGSLRTCSMRHAALCLSIRRQAARDIVRRLRY
jgi:hypothetical protein